MSYEKEQAYLLRLNAEVPTPEHDIDDNFSLYE